MEPFDFQKIKQDHPINDFLSKVGVDPVSRNPKGELRYSCPLHEERTPSFDVNLEKQAWVCRGGCGGGDVIVLAEKIWQCTRAEAAGRLSGRETIPAYQTKRKTAPMAILEHKEKSEAKKLVATYDYHDERGGLAYQVLRYEPKTFRQRVPLPDGSFSWSMEGVERYPFQLPKVLESEKVAICEGEKDCLALTKMGMVATCNPGGAKKWLPGFSRYFHEKCVFIIPDNDEPGQEHAQQVLRSLEGKVKWAKILDLPKENNGQKIKDFSDFVNSFSSLAEAADGLSVIEKRCRHFDRGVDCEAYSMDELVRRYSSCANSDQTSSLDLKRWLPALDLRPLVKGDLMAILGATGNLKTATAQNIIQRNADLSTLFFEMELAEELWTERSIGMAAGISADEAHAKLIGQGINWKRTNRLSNLYTCLRSDVSMKFVDEMIERSSLKIGKVPDVFVIDYIQLIRGPGNRYDRVSDAAEEAKVLAKKWGNIGILLSQVGRPPEKTKDTDDEAKPRPPSLEDGKGSGSIENSCGLVIGVWKDSRSTMKCRVLKNTRGQSGQTVDMEIRSGLRIDQRSDYPAAG